MAIVPIAQRLTDTLVASIAARASSAAISRIRKSVSDRPRARAIAARLRMRSLSVACGIVPSRPLTGVIGGVRSRVEGGGPNQAERMMPVSPIRSGRVYPCHSR